MEVSWRLAREITVLDLAGAFAVSSEDTEIESLRSAVQTLIAQGRVRLALNVDHVTSIDARGLGELVRTATTLRRRGGELVLVSPTPRVQKMLSVTQVASIIDSCDSEHAAFLRLRQIPLSRGRAAPAAGVITVTRQEEALGVSDFPESMV
ncbi:MAG TPA: STAS domain-containing protein [Vicinamibacterales bacterium]|nr:STAS domain-containing protein [Vicinamibacterales bacterium]